jgi:ERCC4-related helicase
MKFNFLKRLESSVESFELTISRTIKKINGLIAKIDEYINTSNKDVEIDPDDTQTIDDSEDEELNQAFEIGAKLKFNLAHMDCVRWRADLMKDKDQLLPLYNAANSVTVERDAKLKKLKEIIKHKYDNPTINNDNIENRKILVFTAFSDTANYIYKSIKPWVVDELKGNIALVTGGSEEKSSTFMPKGFKGQSNFEEILTNFAPVARHRDKIKSMPQEGGIDILIATDCISEGQNLQDCDYMVNYDIHWNPVRIIQRFGRIDRIGSRNKKIHMQNFWPTPDLNKYIDLKARVESRMALVDITDSGID